MKSLIRSRCLLALLLASSFLNCQKSPEVVPEPPPPGIPVSGSDTGIDYTAQAICDHVHNETALTGAGWTKAFDDNFTAGLSNWTSYTGVNASSHLQYYKESNVVVDNGFAQLVVKKETSTTTVDGSQRTYNFTSGLMQSNTSFSANETTPKVRIAARMKLPRGYGLQANFMAIGGDYPKNGQITMVMANRFERNFYATNYAYGPGTTNVVRNAYGYISADADLSACYHVYETEWTRNSLNFYLDGKLVEQKTTGGNIPALFGKSQRLSLYVAVSSDLLTRPQIETGTLSVDWIKVFTSK